MNHRNHSYFMIALMVVGAGLFFSGLVNGNVLFLLWPLACMAMMGFMMWGMMRMSSGDQHTHHDAERKISLHK